MKQMSLIEMDGFLKGRCIPRDLKVNETNAEYLVRKFAEAEAKCAALAAENAAMHETIEAVRSVADNSSGIAGWHLNGDIATWEEILPEINDIETTATDAFLAEVRAQAFNDLCSAFVKHASVSGLDDGDCVTVKEATDAMLHGAEPVSQTYKLNELSGNSPVTPDGWISCSERMPNEEDVLVYCSDTKEQMVGFHKGKGLFQFFYMNGVEGVCEPSHWMPLPEPPRLKEL